MEKKMENEMESGGEYEDLIFERTCTWSAALSQV